MNELITSARAAQAELHTSNDTPAPEVDRPGRSDWLHHLVLPGEVVELCALGVATKEADEPVNLHGYFEADHLDEFARQAALLSGCCPGVYWTVNPVNPTLLARAPNGIYECRRRTTDNPRGTGQIPRAS